MGTNYYAQIGKCQTCGRFEEEIHIGKSSAGWRFNIEIHKEFYNNWDEFLIFINRWDVKLFDEYKTKISPEDLLELIKEKKELYSHLQIYSESKGIKGEFADLCEEEFS
jgi:hypothetical protein